MFAAAVAVAANPVGADTAQTAVAVDTAHAAVVDTAVVADAADEAAGKAIVNDSVDDVADDTDIAADTDDAVTDTAAATKTADVDTAIDTVVVGADMVDTAAVPARVAEAPTTVRFDGLSYTFSGGLEFLIVLGEISTVGVDFEFGLVYDKGLFLSLDLGGGIHYIGGGLNAGYIFTGGGHVKNALGATGGYRYTALAVNFVDEAGKSVDYRVGDNFGFGGIFWKIMSGKTHKFDFTNKIVFGHKKDSAWYDREKGEIYTKDGFSVTYYVSIGYIFMKRGK
jgi:hypothetical protein